MRVLYSDYFAVAASRYDSLATHQLRRWSQMVDLNFGCYNLMMSLPKQNIRHIEITFFARALAKSSFYCTAANLPLIIEMSDHHSYICKESKDRSMSYA